MSEDVYVLKNEISEKALEKLNDFGNRQGRRIFNASADWQQVPSLDDYEDWIAALKSGKRIVNPLSPEEELRKKNTYTPRMLIGRIRATGEAMQTVCWIA